MTIIGRLGVGRSTCWVDRHVEHCVTKQLCFHLSWSNQLDDKCIFCYICVIFDICIIFHTCVIFHICVILDICVSYIKTASEMHVAPRLSKAVSRWRCWLELLNTAPYVQKMIGQVLIELGLMRIIEIGPNRINWDWPPMRIIEMNHQIFLPHCAALNSLVREGKSGELLWFLTALEILTNHTEFVEWKQKWRTFVVLSSLDFDRSPSMWCGSKHKPHNGLYSQSLIWKSHQILS